MKTSQVLLVAVTLAPVALALENGLSRTPAMGWNSWNAVRCNGLNETVVRAAADNLVSTGLAHLGYEYVVVDDCWQDFARGADGALKANPTRFPNGIKAVADYVHSKGLKFGLYGSPGTATCAMIWDQYPAKALGSLGHEQQDANSFAAWGVDYVKYDWCSAEKDGVEEIPGFSLMRDCIAKTSRPMVYAISEYGVQKPWTWGAPVANSWRTTSDIQPSWSSISGIITNQAGLSQYAGPGHWNDPDMLQVGNGALTAEETKSHIVLWAMLASPLMIGTHIERLPASTLNVLKNPRIIAIDQDPVGNQAHLSATVGSVQLWVRNLQNGRRAVAVLNLGAVAASVTVTLPTGAKDVVDGWAGSTSQSAQWTVTVPVHGTLFYTFSQGAAQDPTIVAA